MQCILCSVAAVVVVFVDVVDLFADVCMTNKKYHG
jgi:hypothetical protein